MKIEALHSAIDIIAKIPRRESVKKYGEQLTNAVRCALCITVERLDWNLHRQELEDLLAKGMKQHEIAKVFGCSQNNISMVIRRLGIDTNYNAWTKRDIAGLKNLREQGWKMSQIAERLGRSEYSIAQKVKVLKLPKLTHPELARRHSKSAQGRVLVKGVLP